MKKTFKTFVFLIFIYIFLLVGSELISNKRVIKNIKTSINETNYYNNFYQNNNLYSYRLDNYTDFLMMNILISGDNNLDNIINNYFGYEDSSKDENINVSLSSDHRVNLKAVLDNKDNQNYSYGRYWLGYRPFLKVLLSFFTYGQTKSILFVSQIILISCVYLLLMKKANLKLALSFLLSLVMMNFVMFAASLQYSTASFTMYFSSIILLLFYKKKKFDIANYFFVVGSVTCFIDFFTFPLISLIIPLLIALVLKSKEDFYNYKDNISFVFKLSIFWALGYFGTFIAKWLLGTIIYGLPFIETALISANKRIGIVSHYSISILNDLLIGTLFEGQVNKVIANLAGLGIVVFSLKNFKTKIKLLLPYILIALIPIAWIFIFNDHSGMHFFMVYRNLGLFFLVIIYMALLFIRKKVDPKKVNKLNKNDLSNALIFLSIFSAKSFPWLTILFVILISLINIKNKKVLLLSLIVILYPLYIIIMTSITKNYWNNDELYKSSFTLLKHHIVNQFKYHIDVEEFEEGTIITKEEYIDRFNNIDFSYLVYECDWYVIIDSAKEWNVDTYINCNDIFVSDNYYSNLNKKTGGKK